MRAIVGHAFAQLLKHRHQHINHIVAYLHLRLHVAQFLLQLQTQQLLLKFGVLYRLDGFKIEAALQSRRHFVHTAVAQVGGGDDIESRLRQQA